MSKKIFLIAGEASGDLHGARLIEELRRLCGGDLQIFGVGGKRIRETGAKGFLDLASIHTNGITEVLAKIPQYWKIFYTSLDAIRRESPDAVVLIDNPGFNLPLAKKIHSLGIPVIYYIAPQVWAWGKNRIHKIKKFVNRLLVVFEFEKAFFEAEGIPARFVGHPLADILPDPSPDASRDQNLVSLLPGSRPSEVRVLYPIFLKAAAILSKRVPQTRFCVVAAPTIPSEWLPVSPDVTVSVIRENPYETIRRSKLAIACSGTVTLECALLGTPVVITNRASFLTYLVAKRVIRAPFLGLPNLILGERKFPELLQYDATPENLAREAERILTDTILYGDMQSNLKKVHQAIGARGASARAAREILEFLEKR